VVNQFATTLVGVAAGENRAMLWWWRGVIHRYLDEGIIVVAIIYSILLL
jgi:hypothetical protein